MNLDLPEIVDVVQTNVPIIQVKDRTLDVNFVLADGTLLHIEFEASEPTEDDQIRYAYYDLELYKQRRQKIHRLVIYAAGIKKTTTGLDIGVGKFAQTSIHLDKNFDGDKILQEIKDKIKRKEPLTGKEQLEVTLLPMMHSKTVTKTKRAFEVVEVLKGLKDNHPVRLRSGHAW